MTTTKQAQQDARNRLIAAALYVAVAERGGLDHVGHREEIDNAHEIMDDAANSYVTLLGTAIEGE